MKSKTLKLTKFKKYHGRKKLYSVDELNVTFSKMQIVGVNGSGKTTLLKYLKKKSNKFFNAQVGFVSQKPMLLFNLDIKTNCQLLLSNDYSSLLEEYFNLFPELDNAHIVSKLSGGQRQVLNILFNLHEEKDMYFIDEPFNNLDSAKRKYIKNKLRTLDRNLIIVNHGDDLEFCDCFLEIENKTIKERV